jgi:hypothetical protein
MIKVQASLGKSLRPYPEKYKAKKLGTWLKW